MIALHAVAHHALFYFVAGRGNPLTKNWPKSILHVNRRKFLDRSARSKFPLAFTFSQQPPHIYFGQLETPLTSFLDPGPGRGPWARQSRAGRPLTTSCREISRSIAPPYIYTQYYTHGPRRIVPILIDLLIYYSKITASLNVAKYKQRGDRRDND